MRKKTITKIGKRSRKKPKCGRPTKYKPEFCRKLIDFFDIEPWEKHEIKQYYQNGKLRFVDVKLVPSRMPTLRDFAKSIGIGVQTLYNWMNEKNSSFQQEFHDAFECAKEMRKDWLIDLGLSGLTPPLSYKFTAISVTDMRDQKDVELGRNLVVKFNINKQYENKEPSGRMNS